MLFGDGASFGFGCQEGFLWSEEPLFIPWRKGQSSLSVLGTLNAISFETVFVDKTEAEQLQRKRETDRRNQLARSRRQGIAPRPSSEPPEEDELLKDPKE